MVSLTLPALASATDVGQPRGELAGLVAVPRPRRHDRSLLRDTERYAPDIAAAVSATTDAEFAGFVVIGSKPGRSGALIRLGLASPVPVVPVSGRVSRDQRTARWAKVPT